LETLLSSAIVISGDKSRANTHAHWWIVALAYQNGKDAKLAV